jgi:gluconate 2-dehydrogenase gamma chain
VTDPVSRREFVEQIGALGATWMLALSPAALPGINPHQHGAVPAPTLRYFRTADAREIEAIAERVIPSDDGPGAKEAGALYFIDGGLATFAKDQQPVFRDGLDDLAKRVASTFPAATHFSALTDPQKDQLLKSMEETPFFQAMRFATIAGMLCLPTYGGNRDYVGWKAIGLKSAPVYAPPFGYYDRPDVRRKMLGSEDA